MDNIKRINSSCIKISWVAGRGLVSVCDLLSCSDKSNRGHEMGGTLVHRIRKIRGALAWT